MAETIFAIEEDSRASIPDAKRASGFQDTQEPFEYFNQALFELKADYVLGSASQLASNLSTLEYQSADDTFRDVDGSEVTFSDGDRIFIQPHTLIADMIFPAGADIVIICPTVNVDTYSITFECGVSGSIKITGTGEIILDGQCDGLKIKTSTATVERGSSFSGTYTWNGCEAGDRISPDVFGAIPNDNTVATANSTAFQTAADYAIEWRVALYIPDGDYYVNSFEIDHSNVLVASVPNQTLRIICDGTIYAESDNVDTITIGNSSGIWGPIKGNLRVRNSSDFDSGSPYSDCRFIKFLELHNSELDLDIKGGTGGGTGILFAPPAVKGITYNSFRLNYVHGFQTCFDFDTNNEEGWVNENKFFGGRVWANDGGLIIDADSGSDEAKTQIDANSWFGTSFEGYGKLISGQPYDWRFFGCRCEISPALNDDIKEIIYLFGRAKWNDFDFTASAGDFLNARLVENSGGSTVITDKGTYHFKVHISNAGLNEGDFYPGKQIYIIPTSGSSYDDLRAIVRQVSIDGGTWGSSTYVTIMIHAKSIVPPVTEIDYIDGTGIRQNDPAGLSTFKFRSTQPGKFDGMIVREAPNEMLSIGALTINSFDASVQDNIIPISGRGVSTSSDYPFMALLIGQIATFLLKNNGVIDLYGEAGSSITTSDADDGGDITSATTNHRAMVNIQNSASNARKIIHCGVDDDTGLVNWAIDQGGRFIFYDVITESYRFLEFKGYDGTPAYYAVRGSVVFAKNPQAGKPAFYINIGDSGTTTDPGGTSGDPTDDWASIDIKDYATSKPATAGLYAGHIKWNSAPAEGEAIGWIFISGTTWYPFGPIQDFPTRNRTYEGTGYPTTGTFVQGDVCWNTAPTNSGQEAAGWICTTSGTDTAAVWGRFGMPGREEMGTDPTGTAGARGEMVWDSTPSAGGSMGWVCTTAGAAGVAVWKTFGAIAA